MESKGAATAPRKRRLSVKTADPASTTGRPKEGEEEEERREEEEPVSPTGRLFHQRGFDCCIVAVIGLGKPIDVAAVKAGLEATLVRHPRFCSIPVLDESGGENSRWVRTKVSVEDHIVIPNLHPFGSGFTASPDQVVEDYIFSLTSTPIDRSRPLWELHALNIPTSDAAAVAVLRVHHSLGDGASLVSLLLACTRKASDPDALPTLPAVVHRRMPPPVAAGGPCFLGFLLRIWALLVVAWNTLVDIVLFTATVAFLKDTPTPLAGSEGVEFRPKRIAHRTVSLDDIKAVKKAMNCTVNDVLVGVISAGLSRYLSRRVDEKKRLSSNIRLRSTLLVNLRSTPGIQDLAKLMADGKDGGPDWGNLIGYMILPFTICSFKDPLDYVRRGKMIAERKKRSLEAIFTYKSAYFLVKCFGIKMAAYLCHRVLTHTTLSFSNIVGPSEAIEFFGHPLVYIAPTTYGHPQALTVHCQSYMNKMKVTIAVDEGVIPDPHRFLLDFAESLELMREAIN